MKRLRLVLGIVRRPSDALPRLIRATAEGVFGKEVEEVYWWLAGKKTWITIIISAIAFILEQLIAAGVCTPGGVIDLDCGAVVTGLYSVAAMLLGVGLLDGAVRLPHPIRGFSRRPKENRAEGEEEQPKE